MDFSKNKITVAVLTRNEEKNLERCLNSVKKIADEILVIDEFSHDRTMEIAAKFDANVIKNKNSDDFGAARNLAMEKAKNNWVFFVDADEELKILSNTNKYYQILTNTNKRCFRIRRTDILWGKEIKHGENGKWNEIRLVKKEAGHWKGKVHERFAVNRGGAIGKIKNTFLKHYPHQTIAKFLEEINNYSSIRAKELDEQSKKSGIPQIIFYPLGKFVFNYFFLFGFLDGTQGFVVAVMMGMYSFLTRAKLYLIRHRGGFFNPPHGEGHRPSPTI